MEKATAFPPFFLSSANISLPSYQTYDAFGRRVKKLASGVTTIYNYDVAGNLSSESEADGTPLRDIVYLNGERIAMRLYGSQAGWYYFVNDHLGTPRKVVDSSGSVVWQAAYLPFGKAQVLPGSSITNNFRFPGQYYDAETELHQNWHRYYMPGKGRYLTPDPIGVAGGINLYAYVMNAPINDIDPYGLARIEPYNEDTGEWETPPPEIIGIIVGKPTFDALDFYELLLMSIFPEAMVPVMIGDSVAKGARGTGKSCKVNFGKHLKRLKGVPPAGMPNPHAHHILFKKGLGKAQRELVEEGQAILKKHGIDPIMGSENLVWAPNKIKGQHGIDALKQVVNKLREADAFGKDAVVDALREMGEAAAKRR